MFRVYLQKIVDMADFLCTTPAVAAKSSEKGGGQLEWKRHMAQALLVDEAAKMHLADFLCVWGNCGLPCIMGGDPKQLSQTVMAKDLKDKDGYVRHRLSNDASLLVLECLMVMGWPIFRQNTQQRMAKGLFDVARRVIYPNIDVTYGERCDASCPEFQDGYVLEKVLLTALPGKITPSPRGSFLPAFVHCKNSKVDILGTSRLCKDQVKVAMNFALRLLRTGRIHPRNIGMVSPYKANVKYLEELRKEPAYQALNEMPPASTVDGYQGKDRSIMFVIMGTTHPKPGPGFTRDANQLCVLLTRQVSGSVLFGDFHVAGPDNFKGLGVYPWKDRGNKKKVALVSWTGDLRDGAEYVTAEILKGVYKYFGDTGRVGLVDVKNLN